MKRNNIVLLSAASLLLSSLQYSENILADESSEPGVSSDLRQGRSQPESAL